VKTRLVLVSLLASLPLVAAAQEATPAAGASPTWSETSLGVRLGAVFPQHSDLDGFENGFAFEVFLARRLGRNFAIEGSIGRFAMSATATYYDPTVGTVAVNAQMVAVPLVVSLKAIYPVDKFEIYGSIGGGLYFMSFSGDASASGYGSVHVYDSDNPLAFHVGAGIQGRVAPRVMIGADLKYVVGEASFNGSKGSFDSFLATGSISYTF
jgi:opacity protein-like surface antigen